MAEMYRTARGFESILHSATRSYPVLYSTWFLSILFFSSALAPRAFAAQTPPPPQPSDVLPRNFAVEVSAETQTSPPQITLSWPADPNTTGYTVFRKAIGDGAWPAAGAPLAAGATGYTDTNVSDNSAYEYKVVKSALETANSYAYTGYGFVYAGIRAPVTEFRGTLILLVDSTQAPALLSEIERLIDDLNGDGWIVVRHDVSRGETVPNVKGLIAADYNADAQNVRCVFLLGHIPVPHSGLLNPDGHAAHLGAWPADGYYANISGTWTDTTVNDVTADRAANHNIPGDGKFDQSAFPSPLELQIGRVDLADMPSFHVSETDLLRQYLDKDHAFRQKSLTLPERGLIDDNFTSDDFAAAAWFGFAAVFKAENNSSGAFFPTLGSQGYLWAYGCGPGNYISAVGVGGTADFAANDTHAVFTQLFGSYFGDWDNTDNFLRAPLCSKSYTLTSVWGARPWWYFHPMALGETIGFSVRLSQNNDGVLYPGSSRASMRNIRGVHMALMGDPTLRLHAVSPPSAVTTEIIFTGIKLSWTASSDTVEGYHVYRAAGRNAPFKRVNHALLTGTTFIDSATAIGTYRYLVRAVKLETGGSGSYYNPSQAAFADVNRLEAGDIVPEVSFDTPSDGATFLAPATITLGAEASDADDTVSHVDFYAGETLIGRVSTAPFSFMWSDVAPGDYVLTAVAVDSQGLEATSSAVHVTVRASISYGLNPVAMTIQRADVKLRFPSTLGKDALDIIAVLPLNDGFNPQGQRVDWEIGGVAGSATLDAKGRSAPPAANVRVQLRYKALKRGEAFTARSGTLTIALKNQSLGAVELKNISNLNATTPPRGTSAAADIDIVLQGHQAYRASDVPGTYRARKDKTASWLGKSK